MAVLRPALPDRRQSCMTATTTFAESARRAPRRHGRRGSLIALEGATASARARYAARPHAGRPRQGAGRLRRRRPGAGGLRAARAARPREPGPRAAVSDRLGRPRRPGELLFVGRLERRKGVDVLLEAARSARGRMASGSRSCSRAATPTDTASGETYRAAFEREADPAGWRERVRFAGPVDDARARRPLPRRRRGLRPVALRVARDRSGRGDDVRQADRGLRGRRRAGGGRGRRQRAAGRRRATPRRWPRALRELHRRPGAARAGWARARGRSTSERFEGGAVSRAMADLFAEAVDVHATQPPEPSAAGNGPAVVLDERAAEAEHERGEWERRAQTRRVARLRGLGRRDG